MSKRTGTPRRPSTVWVPGSRPEEHEKSGRKDHGCPGVRRDFRCVVPTSRYYPRLANVSFWGRTRDPKAVPKCVVGETDVETGGRESRTET